MVYYACTSINYVLYSNINKYYSDHSISKLAWHIFNFVNQLHDKPWFLLEQLHHIVELSDHSIVLALRREDVGGGGWDDVAGQCRI